MEFKLKEKMIVKLFLGCPIDSGLKHLLNKSARWKEAEIDPRNELVKTVFAGKEYMGTFLGSPAISLNKLKLVEEEIKRKLIEYCPTCHQHALHIKVFSQVFIL